MPAIQNPSDNLPSLRGTGLAAWPCSMDDVAGSDAHFIALLNAYRASGGLAEGSEIAARQPVTGLSALARAIASRAVVSVDWAGQRWLPIFQFEPGDLAVRPLVRVLIDELSDVLDDWELADWFVEPNAWLRGAPPLQLVDTDFARVHDTARALRFACGH
ncbi:hypothetical protein ACSFA2_00795 [Variovorax sp. LT2P21]|uniref:hypothetical protein n=1 Tax=Variovorax sp. LT2P21 TaxID=3443731 RepID=UPI003F46E2CC